MVGTTPMSSPAWRQATACSCMAFADSMTAGLAGGGLVLRGGGGAATHGLVELARGGFDRLAQVCGLAGAPLGAGPSSNAETLSDATHRPATSGRAPSPTL